MKVEGMEKLMSLGARGRIGLSGGLGSIRLGYTGLGFFSEFAGIYQRRTRYGRSVWTRMTIYRPSNPQTPAQQAWRAKFAAGKVLYDALTPEQKEVLRVQGQSRRMSGYNLFMSRHLQSVR